MATLGRATAVQIDAGPTAVASVSLVVPCLGCSPTTDTVGWVSGATPPGKDSDEIGMDSFSVLILPGTDQVTITLRGLEGFISGKFIVRFCVG